MSIGPRGSRRTAVHLALVCALVAGFLVGIAGTPATAADSPVRWPQGTSATWVDDQGRQLTVTQVLRALDPPEPIWDLQVARDTPSGQSDPTWTDDAALVGLRTLGLAPPTAGARLDPVMAADGLGAVTLVWNPQECEPSETCTRWFQVVDVEGVGLGTPTPVDDVGGPIAGLPDGTLLLGTADGPLERRASDGAALTLPVEIAGAEGVWDATVDTEHRLLLARKDGSIVRQGTGGGVDLTVDSGCDPQVGIVIGPAPGGGFATACGTIDVSPSVTSWDAEGAVAWSATDAVAPDGTTGLAWPSHVVGDGDGGVWVAGRSHPSLAQTPRTVLARFTSDGPQEPAFARQAQRPGARSGFGMGDLRPALDRHVAFAFDDRCCDTVGGPLPFDRLIGGVLPDRPSPPTCLPGAPVVEFADARAARIGFTTCPAGRPVEEPTDYRIEVIGPEQTRATVVDHAGPGAPASGIVLDLYGGTLLRTQVTARNAQGTSLAGPRPGASLVLPFASVEDFTFHMYATLLRDIWWDRDGPALVEAIESGEVTPVEQVVQMLQDGVAEHRVEPVARLYYAVLDRHPDTGGLRYWLARHEAGQGLGQIAERMADSSEFRRRYGGLTDRGFVQRLYRNVLGRAGDPTGIDFWTARLTSKRLTRGGVVTQFSHSSEFIRRTDSTIQPLAAMFLLRGRVTTEDERIEWATAAPRRSAVTSILTWSTRAQLGG